MKTSLILLATAGTLSFIGPFENEADDSLDFTQGPAMDFGNDNLAGQAWTVIAVTSPDNFVVHDIYAPGETQDVETVETIEQQAVSPAPVAAG